MLILAVGCKDPTQVRLHVKTDVAYQSGRLLSFTAASPDRLQIEAPNALVDQPWSANGDVGTMMVVPGEDDRNARIGIRVVMGVTKDPTECSVDHPDGCIFARRQLQFMEHETLEMPVGLHAICEGVPCDESSTCNALGQCVSARVDSAKCQDQGLLACLPEGDVLPNGVDAGIVGTKDSEAEANVDAEADASIDASHGADLSDGLLAHFQCDDDPADGLTDSSSSKLVGSCEAGRCPTLSVGLRGTACDFDGVDDAVTFPIEMASGAFTITFWAQMDDTSRGAIVSKAVGAEFFSWWLGFSQVGTDHFVTTASNNGTSPTGFGEALVCNPCRMTPSICMRCSHSPLTWYFAHVRWDGEQLKMGFTENAAALLDTSASASPDVLFDAHHASLGAVLRNGNYSSFFDGRLDELRIYGRTLSDEEIHQVVLDGMSQGTARNDQATKTLIVQRASIPTPRRDRFCARSECVGIHPGERCQPRRTGTSRRTAAAGQQRDAVGAARGRSCVV